MKKRLKADLHTHSKENFIEKVDYSALELINLAQQKGFDILSITNHDVLTYNTYLRDYAKEREILLIPGVEITVEGKHVLLYNIKDFNNPPIRTFADINCIKAENNLVVAPHPFFPTPHALQSKLYQHIKLFDALEYCQLYIPFFDFNEKTLEAAKKYHLPLIGGSDTHCLIQFNKTYTLIEAEKEVESVIQAIKDQKVEVRNYPLPLLSSGKLFFKFFFENPINLYRSMSYYIKGR